jgi:cytochrome P450
MADIDAENVPVEDLIPHLDLFDPQHRNRLWEVLAHARASSCPVIKTDADNGYYVITRYDDLRTVAGDPETFSSAEPALRGVPVRMPPVSEDPPIHRDFRKILNPFFSRSYLSRYTGDMRAAARELLDRVVPAGRMEFMNDFALPYTAENLSRVILGETNKERVNRARGAALRISTENTQQAFIDLAQIAAEFLSEQANSGFDGDDVLSAIVNGTVLGRPLTMEEKVGTVTTLFSGGLDTVRGALGNIARHIAEDPGMEDRLRDPDWARADLDELLRMETPITFLARTVTRDTEVSGCPMKAGERVALHFASANRDAGHFGDADQLRFDREKNPHVAFGVGIHRCLGLHFARLQIEIGIEELLSRVTNLRIAGGVAVELSNGVIFTPELLPIEFDRRESHT